VNVRQHTALCDSYVAQQLVELLVVPDGELEMARDDTRLLVVARRVASRNDEELNKLLGHVTIAQGGVLPNIHQNLLPKKTGKSGKGAAGGSQEL